MGVGVGAAAAVTPLTPCTGAPSSAMLPSAGGAFPSHTPCIRLYVSSSPRRRVLGLVIVVPRLTCRACPRRNGVVGEGEGEFESGFKLGEMLVSSLRFACATLAAAIAAAVARSGSVGVGGIEEEPEEEDDMSALPSSDDASTSSGGSRSFSMSDLRLGRGQRGRKTKGIGRGRTPRRSS